MRATKMVDFVPGLCHKYLFLVSFQRLEKQWPQHSLRETDTAHNAPGSNVTDHH